MRASVHQAGRHCADAEMLDPSPSCPLCGFAGLRRPLFSIQRAPDVALLECPQCKGASASRLPKPATLAAYYGGYYANAAEKVTFDNPERFARRIFRLLGHAAQTDFRVLDFGGGDGSLSVTLAELLGQAGARRVTIDLVDREVPPAAARSAAVSVRHSRALEETAGARYDLVLASAIIEHLPEPREELWRLFGSLDPGGLLYARTPWMAPIFHLCGRLRLPFDFTYPAHLHDLGRDFWESLAGWLPLDRMHCALRHSSPSIVETTFSQAPLRSLAAHVLKAPCRVSRRWRFCGGWEAVFERTPR